TAHFRDQRHRRRIAAALHHPPGIAFGCPVSSAGQPWIERDVLLSEHRPQPGDRRFVARLDRADQRGLRVFVHHLSVRINKKLPPQKGRERKLSRYHPYSPPKQAGHSAATSMARS